MATCQDIIRRAYRRAGILPAGVNMSASQSNIGLEHLADVYKNLITGGTLGRPCDYFLDHDEYEAQEYQRVFMSVPATVSLPSVVADKCTGKNRQPHDFAFITVVDPVTSSSRHHLYDRGTATWTDLNDVRLQAVAPLSGRYEGHLTALLAVHMLGDADMPTPRELTRAEGRARLALANRYDDARRTGVGEFS